MLLRLLDRMLLGPTPKTKRTTAVPNFLHDAWKAAEERAARERAHTTHLPDGMPDRDGITLQFILPDNGRLPSRFHCWFVYPTHSIQHTYERK